MGEANINIGALGKDFDKQRPQTARVQASVGAEESLLGTAAQGT